MEANNYSFFGFDANENQPGNCRTGFVFYQNQIRKENAAVRRAPRQPVQGVMGEVLAAARRMSAEVISPTKPLIRQS